MASLISYLQNKDIREYLMHELTAKWIKDEEENYKLVDYEKCTDGLHSGQSPLEIFF